MIGWLKQGIDHFLSQVGFCHNSMYCGCDQKIHEILLLSTHVGFGLDVKLSDNCNYIK